MKMYSGNNGDDFTEYEYSVDEIIMLIKQDLKQKHGVSNLNEEAIVFAKGNDGRCDMESKSFGYDKIILVQQENSMSDKIVNIIKMAYQNVLD